MLGKWIQWTCPDCGGVMSNQLSIEVIYDPGETGAECVRMTCRCGKQHYVNVEDTTEMYPVTDEVLEQKGVVCY